MGFAALKKRKLTIWVIFVAIDCWFVALEIFLIILIEALNTLGTRIYIIVIQVDFLLVLIVVRLHVIDMIRNLWLSFESGVSYSFVGSEIEPERLSLDFEDLVVDGIVSLSRLIVVIFRIYILLHDNL